MSNDEILIIPMSNRRPVSIVASEWTIVAEAEVSSCWAAIRQHDDGRMIVYGHRFESSGRAVVASVGYSLGPNEDYAGYLQLLGTELGQGLLCRAVLAKMPPERI